MGRSGLLQGGPGGLPQKEAVLPLEDGTIWSASRMLREPTAEGIFLTPGAQDQRFEKLSVEKLPFFGCKRYVLSVTRVVQNPGSPADLVETVHLAAESEGV